MHNAITVDLEDWYHICNVKGYSDPSNWDSYENRIEVNTENILRLFRKYNIKATFFVLGYIALKNPDLIKTITKEGHEIASHSFYHKRIYDLTQSEFKDDVRNSIDIITSVTKQKVLGFRAPEWSITRKTLWALTTLRELGILYDSSMVPLTKMGDRHFPKYPTKLQTYCDDIWEFPLTTTRIFTENIPFSGGLALRIAPYFYINSQIKYLNKKGHPAIVYFHPWEFDIEQPQMDLPLSKRFIHYYNIKSTSKKIEKLLRSFIFAPIKDILGLT